MTTKLYLGPGDGVENFLRHGGGKALNMKRMYDLGMPVPEWGCLSGEAFDRFVAHNQLAPVIEQYATHPEGEERIQAAFLKGTFPPDVEAALKAFMADKEDRFLAVRSSGSDEDSAAASFAGQFNTYLFQKGSHQVAESVKKCFASAFTTRAMTYRVEKGLPLKGMKVAVVLQRMLFPMSSGVCFTRNPINPLDRDNLLISASWGVGEGVVSGLVSCDEFLVPRRDPAAYKSVIEDKDFRLDFAGEKLGKVDNAAEKRKAPALEKGQLTELARLSLSLEEKLGAPQDIEWAVEQDGKVHILQTRPITHLPPEAFYDAKILGSDAVLWDNSNIIESYSGVTSPLTFSFASYAYRAVYIQFMEVMGLPKKDVEAQQEVFRNLLGLVRGRIYYHLINWYKLVLMLPGSENNKGFLETMMGVKKGLDPEIQKLFENIGLDKKTPLKAKLLVTGMTLKNFIRMDAIVGDFQREFDLIYQKHRKRDFKAMSLTEQQALYHYLEGEVLTNWKAPIINDYLCMIFFGLLKKLTDQWIKVGNENQSLQNDLLCGQGDLESTEPTKMLMRIARKLDEQDGPAKRKFLDRPAAELLGDPEIRAIIEPFLDRFGFRCANELKLEEPDLHDDPSFVVFTIANYIKMKSYDIEAMERREKEIKDKAEAKVHAALSGPRKWLFFWVLKQARKAVRNRENLRFLRTKIFGIARHLFRGIGRNLHQLGYLEEESDVFYLRVEEIRDFMEGRDLGDDLRALAASRRRLFDHYRKTPPPPDRFLTKGATGAYNPHAAVLSQLDLLVDLSVSDDPNILKGTPCCPGVVEGVVRVAKEFKDAEGLAGDILVTERTDPGWVPLYPTCSGLLIERGSLLSHSAVVARELGLPTVIGINGGLMKKLKTGDRVRIDAGKGVVTILRDPA